MKKMKTLGLMLSLTFCINAAAQTSDDIITDKITLIDRMSDLMPDGGEMIGKRSLSPFPNCSVSINNTNDNGGGVYASIKKFNLLNLLGSDEVLASFRAYYSDSITKNSRIDLNQRIGVLGYESTARDNGARKELIIQVLSETKAKVTIVEYQNDKKVNSTSCTVKADN